MDLDRLVDKLLRRRWPWPLTPISLSREDIKLMKQRPFYLSILREDWQGQAAPVRLRRKNRDIRGAAIELRSTADTKAEGYLLATPIVDVRFENGDSIDETIPPNQISADYILTGTEIDINGPQPKLKGRMQQYYPNKHQISLQYGQPLVITFRDFPNFKIRGPVRSFRFDQMLSSSHPLFMLRYFSKYGRSILGN